ncbi:unnamed protein product [Trifolium pratense]|uniref:Uncharacterized protein n=1 Tax=Trifolium pratense TaxID=57577 RepID=A0ACB0KNM0_TRIPR|nr:unnamed protein product [Trifolium pratense]
MEKFLTIPSFPFVLFIGNVKQKYRSLSVLCGDLVIINNIFAVKKKIFQDNPIMAFTTIKIEGIIVVLWLNMVSSTTRELCFHFFSLLVEFNTSHALDASRKVDWVAS